jgi:lipopolysaccharide/colanic/teichoic acid biosynthesis glycosyltransferase
MRGEKLSPPAQPCGGQNGACPPAGLPAVRPSHRWYLPCKRAAEFIVALVLLVLTAPLIAVAALLIRLTSRGPVFYSQVRLGRFGRLYRVYKLRTMHHNCEKVSGPQWCSGRNDPRVTRVGRFLRRSHIDELPQLWNVLVGDMSLIGPRPERPEFLPGLEAAMAHYRDRLLVRPGLTGLAQVQLPADTDLRSVRRKLAYDLYYVRRVSPWLDLRIAFCTVLYLLGLPYGVMPRLFLLPRRAVVEHSYLRAVQSGGAAALLPPALALAPPLCAPADLATGT